MSRYPTITEIEIKWRKSRRGICIIVEGESEMDDPWFYQQWFGGLSKEITFFPQNGWEQVASAVSALRAKLGVKQVYGIIDRDFAPTVTYNPFPMDGLLRTTKYTLENYLLDPQYWFAALRPLMLRSPKPGWIGKPCHCPNKKKSSLANTYSSVFKKYFRLKLLADKPKKTPC